MLGANTGVVWISKWSLYKADNLCGIAWNDPETGILWPGIIGEYRNSASPEGYMLGDGTALNMSQKDKILPGLKDCFKF